MTKSIERRPLSPDERAVLAFLLSAEFPGCDDLRAQSNSVEVVGICECGCGTVNFAVKGQAAHATCREPIPVGAQGANLDVLLFVRDGLLSSLEIVNHADTRPVPYPKPSDLSLWVPPAERSRC